MRGLFILNEPPCGTRSLKGTFMRDVGSGRGAWIAFVGTALALVSCYGTLVLVAGLSALGVSLAIDEQVWASAISIFALVAFIGISLGFQRNRERWPIVIGDIGLAAILWAMLASYDRAVELAGFAALIAGAG